MRKKFKAANNLLKTAASTVATASHMRKQIEKHERAHDHEGVAGAFQTWAKKMCQRFHIRITTSGERIMAEGGLLIGNHMSYTDIPVLVSQRPVSFVAKAEIENWPFFGPAGKAFGAIYIDRKSVDSRKNTADALKKAVVEDGRCVCVFPEGTTSFRGLDWRPGVFKIAEETGVPVQVFAIYYRPADRAAFEIESMLEHALNYSRDGHVDAYVVFSPVFKVTNWQEDFEKWQAWSKAQVKKGLELQGL